MNTFKKVLVIVVMLFMMTSCFGKHSIKVVSGEEHLDKCQKYAKPGEVVTITTAVVSDAELYVNSTDGTEIVQKGLGIYEFVMPDHDVELKITVIANGGA